MIELMDCLQVWLQVFVLIQADERNMIDLDLP